MAEQDEHDVNAMLDRLLEGAADRLQAMLGG
jgi:hypothetical protein